MDDFEDDVYRDTPLHGVTHAQSAKILIAQGGDLNARNRYRETPLLAVQLSAWELEHDAQKEGERVLGLIEVMVAQGADIHAQTGEGSLLHKVASYFYNEMSLNEDGAKVFEKIIKRLVELGADVNQRNEEGDTPLHRAQYKEWGDCCSQFLLECGADINAQNDYGWTPLMSAIRGPASIKQIEYLMLCEANLNLQDTLGWTALHHAANRDCDFYVKLLLKHRARTDILNKDGQTALQLAEAQGHAGVVNGFRSVSSK